MSLCRKKSLVDAIIKDDLETFDRILANCSIEDLDAGVPYFFSSPDTFANMEKTALEYAILKHNIDMVDSLLKAGAKCIDYHSCYSYLLDVDINYIIPSKFIPVKNDYNEKLAYQTKYRIAELLISANIAIDYDDLSLAVEFYPPEFTNLLIQHSSIKAIDQAFTSLCNSNLSLVGKNTLFFSKMLIDHKATSGSCDYNFSKIKAGFGLINLKFDATNENQFSIWLQMLHLLKFNFESDTFEDVPNNIPIKIPDHTAPNINKVKSLYRLNDAVENENRTNPASFFKNTPRDIIRIIQGLITQEDLNQSGRYSIKGARD